MNDWRGDERNEKEKKQKKRKKGEKRKKKRKQRNEKRRMRRRRQHHRTGHYRYVDGIMMASLTNVMHFFMTMVFSRFKEIGAFHLSIAE